MQQQLHLGLSSSLAKDSPGLLVLNEVERHLGVSLLLQVGDDALADQLRVPDHVQHLVVLPVDQSKLEPR